MDVSNPIARPVIMFSSKPADVNTPQWEAIIHQGSSLLIVAGPGTGKTHTLTYRAAYLSQFLQPHQKVLCMTFTNKAALEMRARLHARWEKEKNLFQVETFHSFGLYLLRRNELKASLPRGFQLASVMDMDRIAQELGVSSKELKRIVELKSKKEISDEVARYNSALRKHSLLDYEDLILETIRLLDSNSDVLSEVRRCYPFICVDEYQDMNAAQHQLLKLLVGADHQITAIGDPNQAIYGFCGSDVRFFQSFLSDFPGAKELVLTENYRSGGNLLAASSQMMAKAESARAPDLVAKIYRQGKLTIQESKTERAESEYVVHQIEKLVGGTSLFSYDSGRVEGEQEEYSFGDIVVLYRLNVQAQSLQEAFHRSGIPFQVSGERSLVELPPVEAFIRYLQEIASSPFGSQNHQEVSSLITAAREASLWKEALERNPSWQEPLDYLSRLARNFTTLKDLIDYLSLQKPEDQYEARAEKVSLMTLHASKGLEFPVVFIVGCEENLLPLNLPGLDADLEEERRIFYVGMTRAKERLYLTSTKERVMFGRKLEQSSSRFIGDIEESLKEYEAAQKEMSLRTQQKKAQLKLFDM